MKLLVISYILTLFSSKKQLEFCKRIKEIVWIYDTLH